MKKKSFFWQCSITWTTVKVFAKWLQVYRVKKDGIWYTTKTGFIRARFAMSPLGSRWKERMPRGTKYIFNIRDEASQIDQKLDGRVENLRMTALLTV